MKKRVLSIALAVAMLLTLLPMSVFTVSAAGSPVVDIPDTTGTGLSSADPIVVDAFAELKAAMEYDGTAYVRLVSPGIGMDEILPEPSSASENAITMVGTKYLELRGFGRYSSAADTKYNAFMLVGGQLIVSGEGGITYKHNSRYGDGAALLMTDANASLVVNGNPSITGSVDLQKFDTAHWAFTRAIAATGGTLTINGGEFYGEVYDGPGVQSYMHRSAMYVGRSVEATIKGGEFVCTRSYSASSPMDSHPVGITLAPNSARNIALVGGTFKGMYITGTEKELTAYLPQGYYYYDLDANTRFVGNTKESTYDEYDNATDTYHRIQVVDVTEGVLQFGILTPTPTSAETAAKKTDLGTLYIGTNQVDKTFSATAARLPDRELAGGFSAKLRTEVIKDGSVIYSADNGNAIYLKTWVDGVDDVGEYQVRYTLNLWDLQTEASYWSTTHTYTMTVANEPITFVRATVAEPVVGEVPAAVKILHENIDRWRTYWYVSDDGIDFSFMEDGAVFESNKMYQVYVVAYPNEYFELDEGCQAVLNDRSATEEVGEDNILRFEYVFATGDGELKGITITTPPAKTTYKEGDSLVLDGLVVTGTFGSGYTRALVLGTEYKIVELGGVKEEQTYFTVEATVGGVTKTATCPITVTPAEYAFTFLEEAPLTFELPVGTAPTAKTLTVQNIGDQRLGASDITLSGANPDAFVLSRDQLWGMFTTGTNSQRDFQITPAEGLAEGVYTATVTVSNASAEIAISMELVLNVYEPITVSGTVFSYRYPSDMVTVRLYDKAMTEIVYEQQLAYEPQPDGAVAYTNTFMFTTVLPGDYTMTVSKRGHVTSTVTLDDVTQDTAVDVDLALNVNVTQVELRAQGYALGVPALTVGATTITEGVKVEGCFVQDANGMVLTDSFIAAEQPYYLTVGIRATDGYDFEELSVSECYLDGQAPEYSTWNGDVLYLQYVLYPLEAVTVDSVEMTLDGYSIGNDFSEISAVCSTEGVYVHSAFVVDDSLSELSGTFEEGESYSVATVFVVADGCELTAEDYSQVTLNGVSAFYIDSEEGSNVYMAVFRMPTIKKLFEITFMLGESPVATQPVGEGDIASEPEEPYVYGYMFTGWYTDNGELYDFSTPVTESFTLTARMVPAHTVSLLFGDTPVGWITVEHGTPCDKPEDPAMEGKVFVGWYLDGELYDFSTPVTEDIDLVATFKDEADVLLGDYNGDGYINMIDAYQLYSAVSRGNVPAEKTAVADMDGSGKVNMIDAYQLYLKVSGR